MFYFFDVMKANLKNFVHTKESFSAVGDGVIQHAGDFPKANWTLLVYGVDASGNPIAIGTDTFTVQLIGSLNGREDVEIVAATQADVVAGQNNVYKYSSNATPMFFTQVIVSVLTLNAFDHIVVDVLGTP